MDGSIDPAAEVLQKLAEVKLSRHQRKTREELSAISLRIQTALQDYDDSSKADTKKHAGSIGVVEDMNELEALLKDNLLKNEYQQKLTIFIIGYKDLCSQRLDILSQLSEFFNLNACDEGELDFLSTSDTYVDDLNTSIHNTLDHMEGALLQLDGVGRDVFDYMGHLQTMTSSKNMKSKKKLERSLQNAKDEIIKMTEKIKAFQQDLGMRDDRIEKMTMHLDAKKMEIVHLKQQTASIKKRHEDVEERLKQERNSLQIEIDLLKDEAEKSRSFKEPSASSGLLPVRRVAAKLQEIRDTALQELRRLKQRVESEHLDAIRVQRELAEHFHVQLQQMRIVHEEELEEWKNECRSHVLSMLEIEVSDEDAQRWMQPHPVSSPSSVFIKDKPQSPYHTSSVCSDVKPITPDETSSNAPLMNRINQVQHGGNIERTVSPDEDVIRLQEKIRSMERMQQEMATEAVKWQEERSRLLSLLEEHKQMQEAAEAEAMRTLEEFAAKHDQLMDEADGEMFPLTEDNLQKVSEGGAKQRAASPSTFSKPTSPMTSRSLVSAYRQKIADRREAINRRKAEGVDSGGGLETPQLKGMFDSGLLEEFLRTYRAVITFKDEVAEQLARHPRHQHKAHAINAIQAVDYDATKDQVQLYLSNMNSTVETILSSVKENVQAILSDANIDASDNQLRQQVLSLQDEISRLRGEYEKRSQHDAAMIMHMQNTLSETQRGNTTAAGTSGSGFPSSPAAPVFGKTPSTGHRPHTNESEVTIVFTRQDNEHNVAALKKSAAGGRISEATFTAVVGTMNTYNDIAGRRIKQLANKLVHHMKMKIIEEEVRSSNLLTSDVFAVLEKMETLQHRRAQDWAKRMDEMTSERRRLAVLLHGALQRLEGITGAFLVKPVVCYKGSGYMRKYSGKISTKFNKHQVEAMLQKMLIKKQNVMQVDVTKVSERPPAPSNDHRLDAIPMQAALKSSSHPLLVAGLRAAEASTMWNVAASTAHSLPASRSRWPEKRSPRLGQTPPLAVPRILQLDVAPYSLQQSRMHALLSRDITSGADRLHNLGRTVVELGLPLGAAQPSPISRDGEESSPDFKSSAPPTTPASLSQVFGGSPGMRYSSLDDQAPNKPLPPIQKPSLRSNVTSVSSNLVISPPTLTPSRSVPEMSEMIRETPSILNSARKDIATSPLYD